KRFDPVLHTELNLSAQVSGTTAVLSWHAVTGAVNYKIYKSTSPSGPFELIHETISTTYQDSGLNYSTNYSYRVSAFNFKGQEGIISSAFASVPSAPEPPKPAPHVWIPTQTPSPAEDEEEQNEPEIYLFNNEIKQITDSIGFLSEFNDFLTLEQKLSIELINHDLGKVSQNNSAFEANYLSAANSFNAYLNYSISNKTFSSVKAINGLRAESKINELSIQFIEGEEKINKYFVEVIIVNEGNESLKNGVIEFEIPFDAQVLSVFGAEIIGSKIFAALDLKESESAALSYSFITLAEYSSAFDVLEKKSEPMISVTGLMTLIQSNIVVAVSAAIGFNVLIISAIFFIKRKKIISFFKERDYKSKMKKIESLQKSIDEIKIMLESEMD
ncbi:MAG: fibronectin type III domain-containing protein, partial [Candidatus Nanoarchaeia archaeon]|nr:fibronectin type III domain-containing protein [Candidatus Nanoarchaeia archaeon]